ncbi:putative bifunctional diguanylate cyclase/phosphodiesterase [Stutzerimonas tarimensis]|uniref:Bifunctional diguanylate cyclase/phosphodiesterase n=1 Tax=Stutzerimonas tarimensis TaxID=1507735 RepID=A0ABV7T6Q8_9GAMM
MHAKLLRLCLGYCLLALAWVLTSDLLLAHWVEDPVTGEHLQLVKGSGFILFTALLLYLLGRHYLAALEAQQAARREHETYLRNAAAVFESTQEGVVVTDAEQRIIHVNPALCTITGYSEADVIGQTPRLFCSGRHDAAFYRIMWNALRDQHCWSGEIWNRRKSGEIYPQWQNIRAIHDEQGEVSHYVAVFSDITLLKRSQEEITHLAHYDQLLDLPNRLLFIERTRQELERSTSGQGQTGGALLLIDLDHFKDINESLGHNLGDSLLKLVAERLRLHQQDEMTLARLGGDEFALLCQGYTAERAAALALRLLDCLDPPFSLCGQELFISASIGIVFYPNDAQDVEQLLRNADSALFKAKGSGRSTYAFYSQDLTNQARQRVELGTALRQALEQRQLVAYYQPVHCLRDGRIIGFEALVRWDHPDHGLISPAAFIPAAEESGLISSIDRWMLQQACRQIRGWLDSGRSLDFVAVNISSRLFTRGELDLHVSQVLAESRLEPGYLMLEITESAVMEDADAAMIILDRLRELGVRLAIDDFGTGYSSLARLKRMRVHKLKIDQGFVRGLPHDPENAAITRSVIGLAHNLGLSVVAEGVETAEQAAFLLEEGCDLGQGFGFGRPCAPERIEWDLERMHYGQTRLALP